MLKLFKKTKKTISIASSLFLALLSQHSHADTCKSPPNLYKFNDIACPYDGFSKVEKNGKYGFVDLKGQILIPAEYDNATSFSEGLAELKKEGQSFFINTQGEQVFHVDKNIEVISDFHQGLVVVKQHGKIGFMNTKGEIAIPFLYDNASDFREDLAVVVKDGLWGFIDKFGKVIIPTKYTQATKFFDGLAGVQLDGKWGFIDKTGKTAIPFIYDYVSSFKNGVAEVEINGEWINIDKTGEPILPKATTNRGALQKQIDKILYKK